MDLAPKPALQRRRLLRRLTRMRENAGLTQLQVSKNLRWSQSKVNRVENGEVGISYTDLSALLRLYEIFDEETIDTMAKMADIAKRPSLPELGDIYSDRAFRRFLELEEIATRIWQFEDSAVPGLLQTERYAEAALNTANRIHQLTGEELEQKKEEIDKKVKFRMSRQRSFVAATQRRELKASFMLDEAVIRRIAGAEKGDASVMAEQLVHLKELSRNNDADIGLVPFSAGLHLGMSGPFVILDFPDVDDAPLLYIENALGDFATTEDRTLTYRFSTAFEALQEQAVRGDRFEALIDDALLALNSATR